MEAGGKLCSGPRVWERINGGVGVGGNRRWGEGGRMGKVWVLKRKCVNGKVRLGAGGMERT